MKRNFIKATLLAAAMLWTGAMTSCSDDNGNGDDEIIDARTTELQAVARQYLTATVYPTYAQLADSTAQLFDKLHEIKLKLQTAPATLTDADLQEACRIFLQARSNYETSEAFLYGAASDFGIDPHIDTWPLDLGSLALTLGNSRQMAAMDRYEAGHEGEGDYFIGDSYTGTNVPPELLGFHGIEFVIFRNGAPRTADDLRGTDRYEGTELAGRYAVSGTDEMIFATAVAGDLRNKCWQMEVAWNADAPARHREKVEDEMGWPVTVGGGELTYGENFLRAGQPGSSYASVRKAMESLLVAGCANIAEEVGTVKMGKPHSGEDINYIESPYSHYSLTDFADNIASIENSYFGGRPELRDESRSLHAYLARHNAELDQRVVQAIAEAGNRIKACPKPFVSNYGSPLVQEAMDACNRLAVVLGEASNWILAN